MQDSPTPLVDEPPELCPQCLTDNVSGVTFCRHCGAPLSSYAAIGPFESLFAEGHVYRRAAQEPRRLIAVAGIWIIFGCVALGGSGVAILSWESNELLNAALGIIAVAFSLFLIGTTTRNYLKFRAARPNRTH